MLSELAEAGFGSVIGSDTLVHGVSIDTRTLVKNNLFFAISGPNFDGHDFVNEAVEKGASGLVVAKNIDVDIPILEVADVRAALSKISSYWRSKFDCLFVAVTGSNGKTTVKEMLANILTQHGKTLATIGNLNNDLGVPLTLLRCDRDCKFAVVEIGADRIGDIADLVELVLPDVAVVTLIGPSHLEGFGSIEGVASAKSEIYSGLTSDGTAVLNKDDEFYKKMKSAVVCSNHISFGFHSEANVKGEVVEGKLKILVDDKSVLVNLPLTGLHNQKNALTAAAVSIACGFNLEKIKIGLEGMVPVKGRMELIQDLSQYRLINDTYNANPSSMKAAIDVLASLSGKKCLVMGDMKELGKDAERFHSDMGEYAQEKQIDYLFCKGDLASISAAAFLGKNAYSFDDIDELIEHFIKVVPEKSNVIVKGSRSGKMEQFINKLRSKLNADGLTEFQNQKVKLQ